MALILAYKNRGITKTITITNADGSTLVPSANDKIRIIIGLEGHLKSDLSGAKLTVASDAPTANGSTFTKDTSAGANTLRLDNADLVFPAGIYTALIDYFDNADNEEWKTVDRQVFVLRP